MFLHWDGTYAYKHMSTSACVRTREGCVSVAYASALPTSFVHINICVLSYFAQVSVHVCMHVCLRVHVYVFVCVHVCTESFTTKYFPIGHH